MDGSGNPLIDALNRNSAAVEKMAEAVKAANPEAVQTAITAGVQAGLKSGLGTAPQDSKAASELSKTAAETSKTVAETLTTVAEDLRKLRGRRAMDYAGMAAVAGLLAFLGICSGWLAGSWNVTEQVAAARAAGQAETASVRAEMAKVAADAKDWANTPIGRRAFVFDQQEEGGLSKFLDCTGDGWKKVKDHGRDVCYPQPVGQQKTITGWYLN